MLKRLLPLIKKLKPQEKESPQKNKELNDSSINLLGVTEPFIPHEISFRKFNHFFVVVVLISYVVFVELIGYNAQLDYKLDRLKADQDKWVKIINSYSMELEVGRDIEKKTTKYKEILDSRQEYEERVYTLYYLLPEGVSMTSLDIGEEEFDIDLEADNVIVFARLIILYLGSDKISELSIESADLSSDGVYSVDFSGIFK